MSRHRAHAAQPRKTQRTKSTSHTAQRASWLLLSGKYYSSPLVESPAWKPNYLTSAYPVDNAEGLVKIRFWPLTAVDLPSTVSTLDTFMPPFLPENSRTCSLAFWQMSCTSIVQRQRGAWLKKQAEK